MKDKIFYNLYDTIMYHRACPLCNSPLTPHRGFSNDQVIFNGRQLSIKNEEYNILLNINSCSITIERVNSLSHYEVSELGYKFNRNLHSPSSFDSIIGGQLILPINFECLSNKCSQYAYMAAVHLDLNERIFRVAHLNSEWISIEKNGDVFDVKNNYLTNKTKYTRHNRLGKTNSCELPLIPLNISNPEETLERLHKLIIFT